VERNSPDFSYLTCRFNCHVQIKWLLSLLNVAYRTNKMTSNVTPCYQCCHKTCCDW